HQWPAHPKTTDSRRRMGRARPPTGERFWGRALAGVDRRDDRGRVKNGARQNERCRSQTDFALDERNALRRENLRRLSGVPKSWHLWFRARRAGFARSQSGGGIRTPNEIGRASCRERV